MTAAMSPWCNCTNEDAPPMDRIWESLLQIYATVDKLRNVSQKKKHARIIDLEKHVKALKEDVSNFIEPVAEAMPIQTTTRMLFCTHERRVDAMLLRLHERSPIELKNP